MPSARRNAPHTCSARPWRCGGGRRSLIWTAGQPGRIEAARLDELRLDVEEARLDAGLRAGCHRDLLAEAQARVAEQPLREHRWALLARAQYQSGQQGDALRTIRDGRRCLAEELGLDPGPTLVALERAILRQDPSLTSAPPVPEPSATCPYQGLVPYDRNDAETFFGREAEVSECLRRLADDGVLVVAGPSGSGKSSLVRAGIAAALERDGRRVVVITPGPHPLQELRVAGPSIAAGALIVDQCEEAFTLCADVSERARFLEQLARHTGPLIVALRADRLGDAAAHAAFARLVERGLYLLEAMGEAGIRAAIEQPARRAGLLVEPGLADLLVREVEGEPGALPLLSHALAQTWANREGRTMTVAGYRASGGIRGAVARSAEHVYEQAAPHQRVVLRDLLLRLVVQLVRRRARPRPDPAARRRHRPGPGAGPRAARRRAPRHQRRRRRRDRPRGTRPCLATTGGLARRRPGRAAHLPPPVARR